MMPVIGALPKSPDVINIIDIFPEFTFGQTADKKLREKSTTNNQ